MTPENSNSTLVSTFATQEALEESDYELSPQDISSSLNILKLPEDARIEIFGDTLNKTPKPPQTIDGTTYHYLSVLPTRDSERANSTAGNRISLTQANIKAAYGLAKIVKYHRPKNIAPEGYADPRHTLANISALAVSSLNSYLIYKGAMTVALDNPGPYALAYGGISVNLVSISILLGNYKRSDNEQAMEQSWKTAEDRLDETADRMGRSDKINYIRRIEAPDPGED